MNHYSFLTLIIELIPIIIFIIILGILIVKNNKEHMGNMLTHTNKTSNYVDPDYVNKHQIINQQYEISSPHIINERNNNYETKDSETYNSLAGNYSYINDNNHLNDLTEIILEKKNHNILKNSLNKDVLEDISKKQKIKMDLNIDGIISKKEEEEALKKMNIQTIIEETI